MNNRVTFLGNVTNILNKDNDEFCSIFLMLVLLLVLLLYFSSLNKTTTR